MADGSVDCGKEDCDEELDELLDSEYYLKAGVLLVTAACFSMHPKFLGS